MSERFLRSAMNSLRVRTLIASQVLLVMFACGGVVKPSDPIGTEMGWNHGLQGRIYDVQNKTFIEEAQLIESLDTAQFVLLGEKHDNPTHHLMQSKLLYGLSNVGAVVLEMLRVSQSARVAKTTNEAEFQKAVNWAKSGWPDYQIYRPLIQAIYAKQLAPGAGSPTRADLMTTMRSESRSLAPLEPNEQDKLAEDIDRAHCGYVDQNMVQMMTGAQVLKDRTMAHELRSQSGFKMGVLIAGNGHVRKDYGVPQHLSETRSLAMLEVDDGKTTPDQYEIEVYDYVVFTPRVDNLDPCTKFKRQLEKIRSRHRDRKPSKHAN